MSFLRKYSNISEYSTNSQSFNYMQKAWTYSKFLKLSTSYWKAPFIENNYFQIRISYIHKNEKTKSYFFYFYYYIQKCTSLGLRGLHLYLMYFLYFDGETLFHVSNLYFNRLNRHKITVSSFFLSCTTSSLSAFLELFFIHVHFLNVFILHAS